MKRTRATDTRQGSRTLAWRAVLLLCLLQLGSVLPARARIPTAGTPVQYNRDVRPVLAENCFACHGPDRNKRQADLRLDRREAALARGVLVPGDPQRSKLVARILAPPARRMPPVSSHRQLSAAQKALLQRWIREGAAYQPHWSYIPPVRPPVPGARLAGYPNRGAIDAFIQERLARDGLRPSPEAGRRDLIRRVTLDLTGLPPSPAEVRAYLDDDGPDAYERLVDRLLASPHFGERMAVPWLDLVRYADTVGFHGDQNQNAWAYRDYVVDSFNRNKPFDRFTTEQLAGDLLPDPTPEQRTATAFNRLNMVTREGGAQPKEYLAKYMADRVRTVGMSWLGSTLGCCECHDHKYDPFTQRDFYSLAAFFADVKQWGVYSDYGYTPNPDLRGFTNDHPFPPEVFVRSPYLESRITRLLDRQAAIAAAAGAARQGDVASRDAFKAWLESASAFLDRHPDGWRAAGGNQPDGSILLAAGENAVAASVEPDGTRVAAIRVEALPHAALGGRVFRKGKEAAALTLSASIHLAAGGTTPVRFRYAGATDLEPRYSNGRPVMGVQRGWRLAAGHPSQAQASVWVPEAPLLLQGGDRLALSIPDPPAGCIRLAVSPFVPADPDRPEIDPGLRRALADPSSGEPRQLAVRTYLLGTAWDADAFARARALESEIVDCHGGWAPVVTTVAAAPLLMRVLPRGNWQDESGPVVLPAVPQFLPPPPATPGARLNRLDLARWLVSPENPLTARVFVNRLWKLFFGTGLSAPVEDFGLQGEAPSHPELLDWLAVEFRENGWDIKAIVRLIVTSATYRQQAKLRPELRERDPNNRLLASQNPRRLEAEFVRDNALAIARLLNPDLGGPPCKPYQPPGYYTNLQFPDREYTADRDDRQYRRGLYMHWQRTFLHPMLANFDAPSREDCIAARTAANTPQQALTLLNDTTFVEAARVLARQLLADRATDPERLRELFERALARPPGPEETASLLAFLSRVRSEYAARPDDARKLLSVGLAPGPDPGDLTDAAAWTSICRVVLNLNETITRY